MKDPLRGIQVTLSGIYSFFRIPYNSLLIDSYPFPPKTTAIGLLAAAMGYDEDKFFDILMKIKYSVVIDSPGQVVSEIASIFKEKKTPIYPITKNFYYHPVYKLFFASEDTDIIYEAERSLKDPAFVLSLGDSENLFYPSTLDYCKLFDNVKPVFSNSVECILPSEIYAKFTNGHFSKIRDDFYPPREISIPVSFSGKGKKRRSVLGRMTYYSGIQIQLKEPLQVYDFDGTGVYLF